MKKIVRISTGIIVAFLLISFVVLSTAGEKETFEGKRIVTIEYSDVEERWIPIEKFEHKDGNYTYYEVDDGFHIYSVNECLVPDDTEIIHFAERD